jgi:RNA recognition motif-containing protein
MTTCMLNKIAPWVTQSEFLAEMQRLGFEVDFLYIVAIPDSKKNVRNRGYGFVNFTTAQQAEKFLTEYQGHSFDAQHKPINIRYADVQGLDANSAAHGNGANNFRSPLFL